MRLGGALLVCASVVIVAGCSRGGGVPTAPAGKVLDTAIRPVGSTIELLPPDVSSATVTSQDAFRLCTNGVADCDASAPTDVVLALATDPDFGPADKAGTVTPRLKNTLV
jgi:hypothetical protein